MAHEPPDFGAHPAFPDGRHSGLNVREYIAAAALQGLLAGKPGMAPAGVLAESAVNCADALLRKLHENWKAGELRSH
jgi:hypothetical protein